MKQIDVSILIPTAGTVKMGFAYSLAGLVGYCAAKGVPSCGEAAASIKIDVEESSVIHANRERLVRKAIHEGRSHILFLDDDMVFEPNILDIMLGRRQEVVVVNYMIKSEPEEHTEWVAVGLDGKRIATRAELTGLLPIHASGFGVSLFDLEAFKRTPQPWFEPRFIPEQSSYTTEDYPCYERLRAAGATIYLDHDASKMVSHLGTKAWNWKNWVSVLPLAADPVSVQRAEVPVAPTKYALQEVKAA